MGQTSESERLTTVLFYGLVLLLAYLVFRVFEPFLVPLGWAIVLVVVFYPLHARLEKSWGRTRAAAASTAGATLILIVPALLVMTLFVRQGIEAARGIQHGVTEGRLPWISQAWKWLNQQAGASPGPAGDHADLPTLVRQAAERVAEYLAGQVGPALRYTIVFFFNLFVTLFALFYLFRDAGGIVAGMRRALPFEEAHRDKVIHEARELIFASVTTSLIIAVVQGLLGGAAFAIVGLGAPVFWGVMMGFFSLLPVVGAWPVWLPAAIWLVSTGRWGRAIVVVAICAVFGGIVDSFLRPVLLAGRARLSGLLVFISVLGGISVFGMLGIVLGPIVVATAAGILDVYTRDRDAETGARPAVLE